MNCVQSFLSSKSSIRECRGGIGDGRAGQVPWRPYRHRAVHPAVVVQALHAQHLEILGAVARRRVEPAGVVVEGIGEANTLDRLLCDAVDLDRRRDAGELEQRRHDVDDVVELPADAALVLDLGRPGDRHAVLGPAEEGRDLLGPLERRVEGPGPRDGVVRVGLVVAPLVVVRHVFGSGRIDAVERQHLVPGAHRRALGRSAVVAADVDDDRIVELAHVVDSLDDATDLVVGVGEVGGVDVGLLDQQLLFFRRMLIP